ncbi:hypothetical protein [Desulfovibrio psychrotolerans]|uniref:Uncharacterized protein n=1 Tax=Desulfovibrio psychrotolerans TaxID=415242 RepID=A0A7J0BWD5_9BACT|nr:hypothetical protein [Desulfovibrio psychrotolerans]GFM38036.1 hypothetical protein DSM19430T_27200 [Desulfovibrio psychrotolerans]
MYIDPAAIKEIASGFEGIRSDLRKIAEIVKKALPDGPIAKSLEAQAELMESLKAQGVTEEGLAEQISAANPYEAKVISELAALEQQYGTLENVPDEVAQRMLTALQMDPDVAILVAAGDGFQIVVSQARAAMARLLGIANSAGECTGATLRLVDDLCKYTVSMATGGVAFPESRERIVAMTLDVGSAIAELASSPLESVKLAGKAYAKKCDEIQQLERQGRYDEAQYELGKLFFDVAASIQGLAAAGKVVVSQGSKLASVVSKVKGPRALTAASEAGRAAVAKGGVSWNPLTGPGPLGEKVASTFRGASYTELTTTETTTLYRVWGGSAKEIGPYWTRTPPAGPVQSTIDSALNPAWGNTATNVTKIEVPAGVKIYEGAAAPQGGLVGGGNQVFIPEVDTSWVTK